MDLAGSLRMRLLTAAGCTVLGMGVLTLSTALAAAQEASDRADVSRTAAPVPVEQQDLDSFLASEAAAEERASHTSPQVFFPDGDVGAAWPTPKKTSQKTQPVQHAAPGHAMPPAAREALATAPTPSGAALPPSAERKAPELSPFAGAAAADEGREAPAESVPSATVQATPANPAIAGTPVVVEDPFAGLQAFAETEEQAREEALRLAAVFKREVPAALPLSPERKTLMEQLARQQLEQAGYVISRPQTMVVVDRNPAVQRLALFLAMPDGPGGEDWPLIGSARVSTGTVGRKHYYITPTGVFINTADRLGYRALGTKNENGIMGIGVKGMRVWDFGWQVAEKGWLPSREKGPIRLEMHATDPVYLEQRLGRTASAGCIRIPSTLNVFLDRHGLLDAAYEHKAVEDARFKALLRPDRDPSVVAGVTVVVVDTAPPKEAGKTAALKDGMAHKPASG